MALSAIEEARVQKKVADNICAKCRREFKVGERVQSTYIVYNPTAYNPEKVTERGMDLGVDNEFVHACCEDPYLEGKTVSRLILPSR